MDRPDAWSSSSSGSLMVPASDRLGHIDGQTILHDERRAVEAGTFRQCCRMQRLTCSESILSRVGKLVIEAFDADLGREHRILLQEPVEVPVNEGTDSRATA